MCKLRDRPTLYLHVVYRYVRVLYVMYDCIAALSATAAS